MTLEYRNAPGGPAPSVGKLRRLATTPEIRSIDEVKRTITFVASTEAPDRYGDIIRVKGWQTKNYQRNPVFLWGHRSQDPPIGKCVSLTIEKGASPALVQTIEFADEKTYPFADTIFKLYKGGFLNAVSVGFKPLEKPTLVMDKDENPTGGYEFNSQELYELSAVPIPANPEALARAVTSGAVDENEMRAFEIFITKCGENNTPWANSVPGVTFSVEAEEQKKPEEVSATVPENRDGVKEVLDKIMQTNKSVKELETVMLSKGDLAEALSRVEEIKPTLMALTGVVKTLVDDSASKSDLAELVPHLESLRSRLEKLSTAREPVLDTLVERIDELRGKIEKSGTETIRKKDVADLVIKVDGGRAAIESLSAIVAKTNKLDDAQHSLKEITEMVRALQDRIITSLGDVARQAAITKLAGSIGELSERFNVFSSSAANESSVVETLARTADLRTRIEKVDAACVAINVSIEKVLARLDDGCRRLDHFEEKMAQLGLTVRNLATHEDDVEKTVCPYVNDPIAPKDTTWDAGKEMDKQTSAAGWKRMSTVINGDPSNKGSYKLPHHQGAGFKVVPAGVRAALGRLESTQMATADRAGARTHLTKHQKKISAMKGFDFDAESFMEQLEDLGRGFRAARDGGDKAAADAVEAAIHKHVDSICVEVKSDPTPSDPVSRMFLKPKADDGDQGGDGDPMCKSCGHMKSVHTGDSQMCSTPQCDSCTGYEPAE